LVPQLIKAPGAIGCQASADPISTVSVRMGSSSSWRRLRNVCAVPSSNGGSISVTISSGGLDRSCGAPGTEEMGQFRKIGSAIDIDVATGVKTDV